MIRLLAAFSVAASFIGQGAAAPAPGVQAGRFSLAGAIEQGGLAMGVAPA